MQSDSSKGDMELQLLRKQMADEKMKKEQVKRSTLVSSYLCHVWWGYIFNPVCVCFVFFVSRITKNIGGN